MAGRIIGAPAPKPGPRTEVLRVTTPAWQHFVLVSSAPFGKRIHWYGGRSHECTQKSDDTEARCHGCKEEWPSKWKGYIDVIQYPGNKRGFLELTASAWELLEHQLGDDWSMRGRLVKICKTKGGRYGRYQIEVLERKHPPEDLPQEADPCKILEFLWRCKNRYGQNQEAK